MQATIRMKYNTAAAGTALATSIGAAGTAPLRPARTPVRGNGVPVKPIGSAVTLHSSHPRLAAAAAATLARRDQVVLEHLPLVKAIAVRVYENLPAHVDLDDLVHAGVLGLIDAANKFNPTKQVVFSSYAKHRIKGAILDSLRQLDWPRATCAAATNKWKPRRATFPRPCSAPQPKPK